MSGTVRYQVFVSSTFVDLRDERAEVLQALWELDCIPTGMEAFVATNEAQWEVIQKVIDECDYYVLIIGGRYGSVTSEGISYTEKEYNYAKSLGIPVLGFVHGDPENLAFSKVETDITARALLESFRVRVMKEHPIRKWTTAQELGGLVSRSVSRAIKVHPRPGWIRNVGASNLELLEQINSLTKENQKFKSESKSKDHIFADIGDLESGNDIFNVAGLAKVGGESDWFGSEEVRWKSSASWDDIFREIGPVLMHEASEEAIKKSIARFVSWSKDIDFSKVSVKSNSIYSETFADIVVQFRALGLIDKGSRKRAVSDRSNYWGLTEKGERYLVSLLARKKSNSARSLPKEISMDVDSSVS